MYFQDLGGPKNNFNILELFGFIGTLIKEPNLSKLSTLNPKLLIPKRHICPYSTAIHGFPCYKPKKGTPSSCSKTAWPLRPVFTVYGLGFGV